MGRNENHVCSLLAANSYWSDLKDKKTSKTYSLNELQ